ncbi:putative repeat protein (TIGR02543 family)/LPXTG-motif cell wall-anchored protein [Aurantimicrobium minutum]|uniref:InlB B-repeat-containing protein n=1 Tax=Aurantimicrobium minutum TaxID=708131 RepID=UPI00247336DA|nr:InlB B-repeat-containing protein [Aurantimicrobium minutum]MDH6532471.1 putative repeat protein (TIGR02543 family)/LPXTG-motif cell wall-anchored protein [Aurantimicrobium minutum]
MKKFSLKVLGATIFALGIVFAGAAAPAQAATLTATSATANGSVTTGAVTVPVTIDATTATAGATRLVITLPTGWSTSIVGGPNCTGLTVTGMTITGNGCAVSGGVLTLYSSAGAIGANTALSVVFSANTLTAASGRDFSLTTSNVNGAVDTGTATLSSGSSSFTAAFNANNGSGSMADQSASSATALSANGFTRSGYTFSGWNTAADGSGTAYADGASYPFTANATMYAQWTAVLANTGIDAKPYIYGGLSLAIVGSAFLLIARRKQNV